MKSVSSHLSHARAAVVLAGLVASIVSLLAVPAGGNLLVNPSFESGPATPPSGQMQLPAGSTAVTGWVVMGQPINLVTDPFWQSGDGTRDIALNATDPPGGIAQTFATTPGGTYDVTFMMAGEPFTTPAIKTMRVSAAGQSADFTFDTSNTWHWAMGWQSHTWSFYTEATSATLQFTSLMDVQSTPTVDNVSVTLNSVTAVGPKGNELALALASENPVRGEAAFLFSLPSAGDATLDVVDVQGRRVASLFSGTLSAGPHHAEWRSAGQAPGLYFISLQAQGRSLVKRFTLLH